MGCIRAIGQKVSSLIFIDVVLGRVLFKGPFLYPFFAGAFYCTVFGSPKKHKKEEKMAKISDYVFFIWVIFI